MNTLRDAHRLEAAGYINAAYGRAFTDGTGKRWLEYWYWYYYNPKSFEGVGVHEGDWESVLVGLDANNRPEEVILSQHTGGVPTATSEKSKKPKKAALSSTWPWTPMRTIRSRAPTMPAS